MGSQWSLSYALEHATFRDFWAIFGPGGKLHPQYFLDHKGHLVVEGLLLVVILYLFLQQAFKPRPRADDPLTQREIDTLINEWQPEPLVPMGAEHDPPARERVVSGCDGAYSIVDGKRVLNLASINFLSLGVAPETLHAAQQTVEKYGVGSCGPRGFYGTIDVHLQLEARLAEFMGCSICTIFSFDIATVASVIPACANRKDIIVADECCSYSIQQGMLLSRAAIHYFKHNDMKDLERVLEKIDAKEKADKKPLCRKLIVVEGIYASTGDIPPLKELFEIKERYKYRLLVEETLSFGVLGPNGRGCCEHFGLSAGEVEVICASMSGALGSIGGFCVGDPAVVEHQRLAGSGYVFSASLPPFLASAAVKSLDLLKSNSSELLPHLWRISKALIAELKSIPEIVVGGGGHDAMSKDESPIIHLYLAPTVRFSDRADQTKLLRLLADRVFDAHNIMLSVPVYSCLERMLPTPSLRLMVNVSLCDGDVKKIAAALSSACKAVLKRV